MNVYDWIEVYFRVQNQAMNQPNVGKPSNNRGHENQQNH